MKFQIKSLKSYRYQAEANKKLKALIKSKKLFDLVEVRHNHNYLLECEGIRHWFVAYEIIKTVDPSKIWDGEYLPIPDFPPYVISKDGKVGMMDSNVTAIPTYMSGHWGFLRVVVNIQDSNGKSRIKHVAELVLLTFTGQSRNGRFINYKDGNPENLQLENLEYVSSSRR